MKKPSPEIEEYLELFVRFKELNKKCRTVDIAKELEIAPASVSEMFGKLEKKGFVKFKPYQGVELTKKGEKTGKDILEKHRLMEQFLKLLGINEKNLHKEACVLEHAISNDVKNAIEKLIKNPEFQRIMKKN